MTKFFIQRCSNILVDGDVIIDPDTVQPKELCELGGEKILVPLSTSCQKKGTVPNVDHFRKIFLNISADFSIKFNGRAASKKEFTMERKTLSITSSAKDKEEDELHLIIDRTEYIQDASERKENTLYEEHLPYVTHGESLL